MGTINLTATCTDKSEATKSISEHIQELTVVSEGKGYLHIFIMWSLKVYELKEGVI